MSPARAYRESGRSGQLREHFTSRVPLLGVSFGQNRLEESTSAVGIAHLHVHLGNVDLRLHFVLAEILRRERSGPGMAGTAIGHRARRHRRIAVAPLRIRPGIDAFIVRCNRLPAGIGTRRAGGAGSRIHGGLAARGHERYVLPPVIGDTVVEGAGCRCGCSRVDRPGFWVAEVQVGVAGRLAGGCGRIPFPLHVDVVVRRTRIGIVAGKGVDIEGDVGPVIVCLGFRGKSRLLPPDRGVVVLRIVCLGLRGESRPGVLRGVLLAKFYCYMYIWKRLHV